MKVIQVQQGTIEWLEARAGVITASELHSLITPNMEPRNGEGVKTYVARKIAERWIGGPIVTFSGGPMEQGTLKEPRARRTYEYQTGFSVREVGFVTTDDGLFGCSPDGLVEHSAWDSGPHGTEIKSPEATAHLRTLLSGEVPKEYRPQIYGSMYATGYESWAFVSYNPQFPLFVRMVYRDPAWMDAIAAVVADANRKIEEGYQKLLTLNGGPPAKG